ncbi:MAG: hypothetical protein IJA58_03860 [Lachnospiraceae bacterium]|nr:hypothetical protein [Lachnospiraceae bacterium]
MSIEQFVTEDEDVVDGRVNRNYKDSVFRMLFRDRSALLSLYNALNGSDY